MTLTLPAAPAPSMAASVLPVDPRFTLQSDFNQKVLKGEDFWFQHRALPETRGRPVPPPDPIDQAHWKLNYDLFVVADGHSGRAVRTPTSLIVFMKSKF